MKKIIVLVLILASVSHVWGKSTIEPLTGNRQPDGTIVYRGKIFPDDVGWCRFEGKQILYLRYDGINNSYRDFFSLQFKARGDQDQLRIMQQSVDNKLNSKGVPRNQTNDGSAFIELELTLIPKQNNQDAIYSDSIIKANSSLLSGNLRIECRGTNDTTQFGRDAVQTLSATTSNPIVLAQTCSLGLDADRTVKLREIYLADLNNSEQVEGGTFPIQLNCPNNATVKAAYIGYSDSIDPSNTGQILSTDQGISGAAQNVGLKLYDQAMSNTPITYGPVPSSQFITITDNIAKFADVRAGRNYTKTYKVYYVKSGGTPTAGSVTGRLKYNFYYR